MSCETGAPYISLRSLVDGVGSVTPATPPPGGAQGDASDAPAGRRLLRRYRARLTIRRKGASAC